MVSGQGKDGKAGGDMQVGGQEGSLVVSIAPPKPGTSPALKVACNYVFKECILETGDKGLPTPKYFMD